MIAQGQHLARAIEAAFGKTQGGKHQIAVQFELLESETGDTITWFGYFTERSRKYTFDALRICGWNSDRIKHAATDIMNSPQEVELKVVHETYEGETRAKVRFVNRPGDGGLRMAAPLAGQELDAFDAEMRGAVVAHQQENPVDEGPAHGDEPPI